MTDVQHFNGKHSGQVYDTLTLHRTFQVNVRLALLYSTTLFVAREPIRKVSPESYFKNGITYRDSAHLARREREERDFELVLICT